MGLLSYIRNIFKRESTELTSSAGTTPRTGLYSQFLTMNEMTALQLSTVYRCVRLLSESVANLPLQYMKLRNGIFKEDTESRLHYLLTVQPCLSMSAFDFWVQVIENVLLDGNAYIVPMYNPFTMDIDQLVLCGRHTVSHDVYTDTYTVSDVENGLSGVYRENEIIHIKGMSPDGKHGLSVLSYARLALSIGAAGDAETLKRFQNGGTVRGLVGNDKTNAPFSPYQDTELESTATDLSTRFESGETIVALPGQVDFKQISLSSADMQFLESRKFTVREICRFFGVHPSFVFDDTSNNYKSAEMANVAFLSNTLNPLLRRIEIELHRKLVAETKCCKEKFQFDRRGLYACDLDSRVKYQMQTIQAGIYTVNEWRREENKQPVEGGDTVLVSANLKGVDQLASQPDEATPRPTIPPDPTAPDNENADK